MSTKKNPNKDSTTPKSSKNGRKGSRRRKGRRGGNNGGGKQPVPDPFVEEAIKRANSRFNQKPPAMGLPAELTPPPKKINLKWRLSPVPKKVEREVQDIVCRPGEFGFLDDERVDEIADLLGKKPITLEQALSLRAALNQEKAVFSHGRLQRRAQEMFSKFPYIAIALTEHVDSIYICVLIIVLTNSHKKSRIKRYINM